MRGVALLILLNLILGSALTWLSLRPRPVTVVPYGELNSGHVPEEAARAFAQRYVLLFDNFTPATIDSATGQLKVLLSPRSWTRSSEALEKRRVLVHEGRMASQMVLLDRGTVQRLSDTALEVQLTAIRRIFIADKLTREMRTRYVVTMEPQPAAPHGLSVLGQRVEEVPDETR